MKILLATYSLHLLAGTETWTMTMFRELQKDHDVDIYVSSRGYNDFLPEHYASKTRHYDLTIINHNICLNELRGWDIDRRIFTSHGVIPALEQPAPGADVYVAVSEEVQDNLARQGYESVVIRNPIDTDYFVGGQVNQELKNILWMNNRSPLMEMVSKASEGYEYRVQTGWSEGVLEAMQWADLVITSGRGVYESLACGRNAMVVNYCGCDGMVTWENIEDIRRYNCSGRLFAKQLTPEQLRQEFDKYDPTRNMRGYVLQHHNAETIARQYLEL